MKGFELYQKVKLNDGKIGWIIEDLGDGNYMFEYPIYDIDNIPKNRKYNDYNQIFIKQEQIQEKLFD